jgi:nitrogen regulatory protein PII
MKLLMIVVDSNHKKDVEKILEDHEVPGYTELPNVLGKGQTGRKAGSRAFPGSSALYFTAVEGDTCETLCTDLKELNERAGKEEGLFAFALQAETVI